MADTLAAVATARQTAASRAEQVADWGHQVAGHDEIRTWNEREFTGPDVRIDVTRVERAGQTIVLTVLTSRGTSRNSSHLAFDIDDDMVTRMTIRALSPRT